MYLRVLFILLLYYFIYDQKVTAKPGCDFRPGDGTSIMAVVEDKSFILFGETHGTNEAPEIVAETVCHLALSGKRVLVGLELPMEYAVPIQNFVNSPDGEHMDALITHSYWRKSDRMDGRASSALLTMIMTIAEMKKSGLQIDIEGFDLSIEEHNKIKDRDAYAFREPMMAKRLFELREAGEYDHVVVLAGKNHSRNKPYEIYSLRRTSIGYLLPKEKTISIEIVAKEGAAWNCTRDGCGVHSLTERPELSPPWGHYQPYSEDADHDGFIPLARYTASKPVAMAFVDEK